MQKIMKKKTKNEKIVINFADPDMHRVNALKKSTKTYKNNLIGGLCYRYPTYVQYISRIIYYNTSYIYYTTTI